MSELTLMDLLDSRENRVNRQNQLMAIHGGVLISMTLNIPGPVKDSPSYRGALYEGMAQMKDKLYDLGGVTLNYEQVRLLKTGPEGFLCVESTVGGSVKDLALAVKKAAIAVEEGSRLGRLFDIDVLWEEGSVSRSAFGGEPRKCLLCDGDAKVCARSRAHKMDDLLAEIDRILEEEGL